MISVIVPVYKVEPYLRQCVESILNQTYSDLEVLLIDDGSPDRCGEICDDYKKKDSRVRVFHTENRGVSAARNLGLREAKGDLIGFVDSDDWIEADMYEVLYTVLNGTEADVSMCGVFDEYPTETEERRYKDTVYVGREAVIALLNETICAYVWNKLYRRKLLRSIVFPEGKIYEDVIFMDQVMYQAGKIAVTSFMGYHYFYHQGSIIQKYTANSLLDFAEAHLSGFFFYQECSPELFKGEYSLFLQHSAKGISKVWRWWHGCSKTEKTANRERIEELKHYSKAHFPFFGCSSWPLHFRIAVPFFRSSNPLSFACLYYTNQLYRIMFSVTNRRIKE